MTFDPSPALTAPVYQLLLQPDGKVLVVQPRSNSWELVRFHTNGNRDDSFACSLQGSPYCMELQNDGKVLLGGQFTSVNGMGRTNLTRLNGDGSVDLAFADSALEAWTSYRSVNSIAIQDDGKIVIGGRFDSIQGVARTNIARLQSNGLLNNPFETAVQGERVLSVAMHTNGKILVGGDFTNVNGVAKANLARLNVDGSLDESFQAEVIGQYDGATVTKLAPQPDGKIIVKVNYFARFNGFWVKWLARLNPDGLPDQSFDPNRHEMGVVMGGVSSFASQHDGTIMIGGHFDSPWAGRSQFLWRLKTDGSLDMTFMGTNYGPMGDQVNGLAIQPDGKILIAGDFTSVNGIPRNYLARLMGSQEPLVITSSPSDQTAEAGSTARFTVGVTGYPLPCFHWFFNDTNYICTTTNAALLLENLDLPQSGSYSVVATNSIQVVTSALARLSIIAPVQRRIVPGILVEGEAGGTVNVEATDALAPIANWLPVETVSLTATAQWWFDVTEPVPLQRFYRVWQKAPAATASTLNLQMIPALTLTGAVGSKVQVEGINQFGPTDAWFTLATVTLTNTSQLYFDVSVIDQPPRLWRLIRVP